MKKKPLYQAIKIILIACILQLTISCSNTVLLKLAYNNLDFIVNTQINRWVTLNDEQEIFIENEIQDFKQYFNKTQTPKLIAILEELKIRNQNGYDANDAIWIRQKALEIRAEVAQQISYPTAKLFASFSDKQIQEIQDNWNERHDERKEEYFKNYDRRRKKLVLNTEKNVRRIYGFINHRQKKIANDIAAEVISLQEIALKHSKRLNYVFMEHITENRNTEDLQPIIANWLTTPSQYYDQDYSFQIRASYKKRSDLYYQIVTLAKKKQFDYLNDTVDELIEFLLWANKQELESSRPEHVAL